jgi:hypothetical protein
MRYKQFADHPKICIQSLPLELQNQIHGYLLVNHYKTHVYSSETVKNNVKPEGLEHEAYHLNGSFLQCLTYKGQRLHNSRQPVSSDHIQVYYNMAYASPNYVKPTIKGRSRT